MKISKGLIIADPWIGYILDGTKDWEMRSSSASHRGWFGLIRKGTGAIYGVAELIEVGAPLSPSDMIASFEHHRIPAPMIRSGEVAKWNTPWKLANVHRLGRPVPYRHKSGAVTWVELDDDAVDGVACQFGIGVSISKPAIALEVAGASDHDHVGSDDTTNVDIFQHDQKLNAEVEWNRKLDLAEPAPTTQPSAIQVARTMTLPVTTFAPSSTGRVLGEVVISEGNITNSHIYLRSIFDHFPADAIGGSNKATRANRDLTVDWGGAEPVHTDLDGQKKLFRARGWISSFYQLNRARAGDRVLIEKIDTYHFRVSLKKSGSLREAP